ncbi:MAG: hypothetical protein LBK60_00270 [Verrucomicrobiales bacterium]|jgi:hypothetical protein|nr:hypothetical protein [Verrucomicrobiales bacterium]
MKTITINGRQAQVEPERWKPKEPAAKLSLLLGDLKRSADDAHDFYCVQPIASVIRALTLAKKQAVKGLKLARKIKTESEK